MEKGFRDCGDSSNKCQNIFLLKKSKGGLPDSIPTAMEMKNSRSPPKKREYPRMYAGQTIQQATTLGMLAAVGGVDFANHAAEFSPRTFVANVSTKAIAPLISREECNESAAKVKQEPSGVVFSKRNYEDEDDESVGFGARGYRRTECEVEHVVCRDDEKYVKSESLKSDKNNKRKFSACSEFDWSKDNEVEDGKRQKYISVKDQMFETFQPWALKTYGDQAKTKTITSRKKNRILKALDGKEHSKPDSSKFRFWVKSKGFRTQRPDNFLDNSKSMDKEWEWSEGKIGTQKDHIELYVASTVKVFGETVYRKVAVVEDFFDIIYDVHVEQGGRNGRHAGQKRTYRIITETYAFLPREAVTKFLGSCPSCMKNLRPFSPGRLEITLNDSSSEYEALNYSSPNESSMDSIQLGTIKTMRRKVEGKISPLVLNSFRENADSTSKSLTFKTGCDIEAIKNSIVSFPGNVSSKIDVLPKTLDYRFRAHENSVYNKELEVEIGQLGKKDFSFSEKFRIQNLLKTDGESEGNSQFGKIISSSVQIKSERESVKEQLMRSSCMPYDKTSHPYQYLSSKYSVPVRRNSFALADRKYIKSPIPHSDVQDLNTSLDLRMKRPPNVSINIGNSWTADTSSNLKFSNEHLSHPRNWDDITTVDLLINISNANNKLKVSRQHCHLKGPNLSRAGKTMIPANVFSASSSHLVDGKGTKVEECAINLSKKSRNESAERGLVSSTTPPKMSEPLDLNTVKPITSTYLRMTRSYGLSDQDALRIDDLVSKDFRYTL